MILQIGLMKIEGKEVPQWAIEAAAIWVKGQGFGFQRKDLVEILDTPHAYRVAGQLIRKFKKEGKIVLFNVMGRLWWFPKGHEPAQGIPCK